MTTIPAAPASGLPPTDRAMTLDFRYYFDTACDGMIVFDASRRVRLANAAFAELVGDPVEALVGRHFEELTEQSDRPAHSSPVQELATFGSVVTMHRVRAANGDPIDVEISSTLLEDGGTFSVVRDMRRRSEFGAPRTSGGWAAPRISGPRMRVTEPSAEARDFRLLFDATPMPAWVYDAETLRFVAVNRAAIEHYGYSEEEFLANTILFIRPSEDQQRVLDYSHDTPGTDRIGAFRHRRKDGELIDVETISYGFELDGRRVRIVVINDVTDQLRVRDQQEQLQAQMLLAQKMDAVGRLAGGVAHDFNNLLSVMLGAAETLGKALASYDPLQEEVTDIRDAVGRGAALTRQLLIFGRKEVRTPGLLDVNDVVAGVERLLMRVLGSSVKIELRRDVEHAPVVADAGQLEQVLVNLVDQRARCDAARRHPHHPHRRGDARSHRRRGARRDPRSVRHDRRRGHRRRDGRGDAQPRLRALLHDEGTGPGCGARPGDGVRDRAPVRRRDLAAERARRGHARAHPPAARRSGRRCRTRDRDRRRESRRSCSSSRTSRACARRRVASSSAPATRCSRRRTAWKGSASSPSGRATSTSSSPTS